MCRRWRRLANTPQLLEVLDFHLNATEPSTAQQRVESICDWLLLRATGHVRRLHLTTVCCYSEDDSDDDSDADDGRQAAVEAVQAFLSTLPSLNYNRQLVDLSIHFNASHLTLAFPPPHSWAVALRSLRRLHISSVSSFAVTLKPLGALAALEELTLAVREVELPATACLPPSLQRVSWSSTGQNLPQQVRCPRDATSGPCQRRVLCCIIALMACRGQMLAGLASLQT